jgi:hypothetical protein
MLFRRQSRIVLTIARRSGRSTLQGKAHVNYRLRESLFIVANAAPAAHDPCSGSRT